MPSGISAVIGIAIADDATDGATGAKNRPIMARIASSRAEEDIRIILNLRTNAIGCIANLP